MKDFNNRAFTATEVMVGIIVSSILVLTAGTMLYYHFRSWYQGYDAVELQRDATIAFDMIARAVRPRPYGDITAAGSTLTVKNSVGISRRFYLDQNSLWYDPDINVADNEKEIISNKVDSLTFNITEPVDENDPTPHSVDIDMTLSNDTESIIVGSVIKYRIWL